MAANGVAGPRRPSVCHGARSIGAVVDNYGVLMRKPWRQPCIAGMPSLPLRVMAKAMSGGVRLRKKHLLSNNQSVCRHSAMPMLACARRGSRGITRKLWPCVEVSRPHHRNMKMPYRNVARPVYKWENVLGIYLYSIVKELSTPCVVAPMRTAGTWPSSSARGN